MGSDYNKFPEGWRRITVKQFAQSHFFSYSPEKVEHRQMLPADRRGKMVPATLFHFYDKTGIGIVNDFWKGKVYYFAFGCAHHFEEKLNDGPLSSVLLPRVLLVCQTCGFTQGRPDSSD